MHQPIGINDAFPDVSPKREVNAQARTEADPEPEAANFSMAALKAAALSWFAIALLGQSIFVAYLIGFYGRTAMQGRFEAWNDVLVRGYVPGETAGNAGVAMHLAFAAMIMIGGGLQLITGVRRLFPRLHRWNGRGYLLSAGAMSLGGLVMTWTGRSPGDLPQHLAISLNAVLILLCASLVLRHALARRFTTHRRWALRLYLLVSGVWFFRLGLSFWIVINHGPVGFDPQTFTGPALNIIAFAQYLLPLAVLEVYFRAQACAASAARIAMAACVGALTLMTAGGIATASMLLWFPRL